MIVGSFAISGCGNADPAQQTERNSADTGEDQSSVATRREAAGSHDSQSANLSNNADASRSDRPAALPNVGANQGDSNRASDNQLDAPIQQQPPIVVRPVFRPTYPRPDHNPKRIESLGFRQLDSTHVELITDLTPEKSAPLMPAVEALHPFLEKYFGALPPARDGSVYKITGYLMADRDKFFASGLAKEKLVGTFHGRQIGAEFWLNDQTLDYYRRHLLLHEIIHCYMRHLPNNDDFAMWYMEGMAELIATHHEEDGQFEFSVMPRDRSRFSGLERIVILQRDVKTRGVRSIGEITGFKAQSFADVEAYAWCWALCRFLDSHPAYQKPFRDLAKKLGQVPFRATLNSLYEVRRDQFATEWALFANGIAHGYDFERAAIKFVDGQPLSTPKTVSIESDRGWQSSGIAVERGRQYLVRASGQFSLAQEPKPWISEANGVSIRYERGRPIGQLLGAIHSREKGDDATAETMHNDFSLGNDAKFTAAVSGTLYLRINDHWGELADNKGTLSVTIAHE